MEFLCLHHYKTSSCTLCPSTSRFFPVLVGFFLKSYIWALSYTRDLKPLPGCFVFFFQCLIEQRDLCTKTNTKCQMSSISHWSWPQGAQHHFSSSSRSWSWDKLAPTSPSEIPELAEYIRQLWFDALHHPLESHEVVCTKCWNQI